MKSKAKEHRRRMRERKALGKLEKKMNDLCPLTPQCRKPTCWDKFGHYESCVIYRIYKTEKYIN